MRGKSKHTIELIRHALWELLATYHPMTLRQLHYAIFSASVIKYGNTPEDYKRLSRVTTAARRQYRDWELVAVPASVAPVTLPSHQIPFHPHGWWMRRATLKRQTSSQMCPAISI